MKRSLAFSIVLLLASAIGPVAMGATAVGPLVPVSGVSPYAPGCGLNPGADPQSPTGEGILFLDSEVEPYVSVNPTDPDNLVGIWQQDRWSNGGARGNLIGTSDDGGVSWTLVQLPGITECSPAGGDAPFPFERASDPWVSFGPDGTVYAMSLVLDIDPVGQPCCFGPNGMAVNVSTDGGVTWSDPALLIFDDDPAVLNDKNTLTADRNAAGVAYAVWDRLQLDQGTVRQPENVFGAFKGPIVFTRTTDGGATWEEPRVIYDPGSLSQTIGNQIVVQPAAQDGTVINFFNEILNLRNDAQRGPKQSPPLTDFRFNLSLLRSPDQGQTWLPRGRPIRAHEMQAKAAVTPDTGTPIRDAAVLFDVAVDPADGRLYAVWQDSRFSGGAIPEVAFSMSADGGLTWTAPIKVSQTPSDLPVARRQAFLPAVSVNDDGVVAVSYYDFRFDTTAADPEDEQELADHWLVDCSSACGLAGSWTPGNEVRVTEASFDYLRAPFARGLFLGDYVGLGSDGTDFFPFFTVTTEDDPANIVVRRVAP